MNAYEFGVDSISSLEEAVTIPDFDEIYGDREIHCSGPVLDTSVPITIPTGLTFGIQVTGEVDLSDSSDDFGPSFRSAVLSGYLDLEPTLPPDIEIWDLRHVTLTLSSLASPDITIDSPERIGITERYRFQLPPEGVAVFRDTKAVLDGVAYFRTTAPYNPDDIIYIDVAIDDNIELVAVTMAVQEEKQEEIIDLSLPAGVNSITFEKIGALLIIGEDGALGFSVGNLEFQVDMEFYTVDKAALEADSALAPAFRINTGYPFGADFSGGNGIFVGWDGQDTSGGLSLPPEGYTGPLSDIKSIKVVVRVNPQENGSDRELTIGGISTNSTITLKAGGEPVFEIAQAVLDLNQFVTEEQRSSSFPGKDAQGQDKKGISFGDFIGDLGENIDIDNLGFDEINFYVYLSGLGQDIWDTEPQLYLAAEDKAEGGSNFPITGEPGDTIHPGDAAGGDYALPELDEEQGIFSGSGLEGHFSTDKLAGILNEKPENLHVNYDFQFGKPYVFEFPEDGIISKTIRVDIFIEIPLKLRLYAEGNEPYGVLSYSFLNEDEEAKDLFGRDPAAEDPYADYIQYLDSASLELQYENTLGIDDVSLVLLGIDPGKNPGDGGYYTFEKVLSLRGGQSAMTLTLRGNEIPNPFIPMIKLQVPARGDDGGKRFGVIKLERGGSFNAVSIRVKAQTYIDQDISF
jgi:hypothetical protein